MGKMNKPKRLTFSLSKFQRNFLERIAVQKKMKITEIIRMVLFQDFQIEHYEKIKDIENYDVWTRLAIIPMTTMDNPHPLSQVKRNLRISFSMTQVHFVDLSNKALKKDMKISEFIRWKIFEAKPMVQVVQQPMKQYNNQYHENRQDKEFIDRLKNDNDIMSDETKESILNSDLNPIEKQKRIEKLTKTNRFAIKYELHEKLKAKKKVIPEQEEQLVGLASHYEQFAEIMAN